MKDSNDGKLVITRFGDTLAVTDLLYRWEEEAKILNTSISYVFQTSEFNPIDLFY